MAFTKIKAQLAEPVKQATTIAVAAFAVALLALLVALGGLRHGA